jgi:hypothetical protein
MKLPPPKGYPGVVFWEVPRRGFVCCKCLQVIRPSCKSERVSASTRTPFGALPNPCQSVQVFKVITLWDFRVEWCQKTDKKPACRTGVRLPNRRWLPTRRTQCNHLEHLNTLSPYLTHRYPRALCVHP